MDVVEVLRRHGHRVTRARTAVWDALRAADTHATADELATEARRRAPGTNLASVYRALALFAELGLAREVHLGDDAGRWEVSHPDDAFHLVCEECGRVDHHAGDLVGQVRDHLTAEHGFVPSSIDLTVAGRCSDCVGRTG